MGKFVLAARLVLSLFLIFRVHVKVGCVPVKWGYLGNILLCKLIIFGLDAVNL